MFQSFYNGLSGLLSFSKGLNQISNNVSNMNTPGFKAKDVFYSSVSSDSGTYISGDTIRSKPGDIRRTGNATNVAIDGNGYFILRGEGKTYYTRAGQFTFNKNNILVDETSGYAVAGIDASGRLIDIDINAYRFLPPEATTAIKMSGNISSDTQSYAISGVPAFNQLGENLGYNIEFSDRLALTRTEKDANNNDIEIPTGEISWTVTVKNSQGDVVATGQVRYDAEGRIMSGFDSISIDNGGQEPIVLDFSGTTGFSAGDTSDMSALVKDGHALTGLAKVRFTETGKLELTYANAEKKTVFQLALANVNSPQVLRQENGALFSVLDEQEMTIERPGSGVMGKIVGDSIELANVDLSEEFAEMMIVQRGYQSSSKVLSIANEMIETLYNSTR
ncbi:hypothetical protein VRK_38680 [Vibrio sp. MEBiC08052]|nr:flagellar basal-body rod protein FlgF [Vibrio sp. MEBiC08052]KUI97013.1 hypothetical protein VRK_38680 [Vibrio sp. MEBiC08052]